MMLMRLPPLLQLHEGHSDRECLHCGQTLESTPYCIKVTIRTIRRFSDPDLYHIKCLSETKLPRPQYCAELLLPQEWPRHYDRDFGIIDDDTRSQIYKYLFPHIVPWKKRQFLSLPKDIDEMTVTELKTELLKRDLTNRGWKRHILAGRLQWFLNGQLANNQKLCHGFCREFERSEDGLIIPRGIKMMVADHFGIGIPKKPDYRSHILMRFVLWLVLRYVLNLLMGSGDEE